MVIQIEKRGLFMLDLTDHHAILGVPVDADAKEIRKNYLKIARRLHPDSCTAEGETAKQLASQMLSKLVNPAWEQLSQDKSRTEHNLILKLKGQAAQRKQGEIEILGNLAQQLVTTNATTLEHFYKTALQDITDRQYQHLDQASELTAQISELNLVYLMRKEGQGDSVSQPGKQFFTGEAAKAASPSPVNPPAAAAAPRRETMADQYYRRAEECYAKGNFAQATLELRDALKIESTNSRCHSLMGMIYLRQNQATMAKIHFNKALEADPNNEMARVGKQQLEGKANQATPAKSNASSATPAKPGNKTDRDKPGGMFGGMFGGKKK
jgi:curved DNA-binding protein CbpA